MLESTGYLIMGLYEARDIATGVSAHALGCMHAATDSGTLQPTFPLMSWSPGMSRLCPRRCSSFHPGRWSCRSKTFDGRHPQPWSILSAASHLIAGTLPRHRYKSETRCLGPGRDVACHCNIGDLKGESIKMATWDKGNDDGPARLKAITVDLGAAERKVEGDRIHFISAPPLGNLSHPQSTLSPK